MFRTGDAAELASADEVAELRRRVAELETLRDRVTELESLRNRVAELEAENAELFVLQQVFTTISSSLSVDDILSTIMRGIHEALHFRRVILFDVADDTLRRRLETGTGGMVRASDETGPVTCGPVLLRMLDAESLEFHIGEGADGEAPVPDPHGQYIMLTLVSRETVRGLFYVDGAPSGHVTESHLRVLLDFSSQGALAIENARLLSETKRLLEETQRLAATDPLTGLPNRRALEELLVHEIHNAIRYDEPLAFAMFDLDDLKKINDSGGHAAGDRALVAFANILKRVSRKGDVVARFAGDEFSLIMARTDREAASIGVERIFKALNEEGLHCSIGVALLPQDGREKDAIFYAADEALYVAKKSGKNRFVFSDTIRRGADGPV